MLKLKDINEMVGETGEILEGEVEIFEGTVEWVIREIDDPVSKEKVIISNYEFLDINAENIDVDNPPAYLEDYCTYILELESITLNIL